MNILHPLLKANPELLKDLFITAVEGGSNYWACFRQGNPDVLFYDIYNSNWSVVVEEKTDYNKKIEKKITLTDLNSGFVLLLNDKHPTTPSRLKNILTETYDAEDADVFFQYAVLGDVIYG